MNRFAFLHTKWFTLVIGIVIVMVRKLSILSANLSDINRNQIRVMAPNFKWFNLLFWIYNLNTREIFYSKFLELPSYPIYLDYLFPIKPNISMHVFSWKAWLVNLLLVCLILFNSTQSIEILSSIINCVFLVIYIIYKGGRHRRDRMLLNISLQILAQF